VCDGERRERRERERDCSFAAVDDVIDLPLQHKRNPSSSSSIVNRKND
jgi:hypothetical protein